MLGGGAIQVPDRTGEPLGKVSLLMARVKDRSRDVDRTPDGSEGPMLRARRGVMLTSGNATRAAERGLAYLRTPKRKQVHGGLRPRIRANDLWDVTCSGTVALAPKRGGR